MERHRPQLRLLLLAAVLGAVGCRPATVADSAPLPAVAAVPDAEAEQRSPPLVVFLGDSLTAGYGLGAEEAFPALAAQRLADAGLPIRAVNAGVSGDTTAGGVRRLDWLLRQRPDLVVVELGANDGLRGLAVEESEENLRRILQGIRGAGAEAMLLGMRMPPNYGPDYTRAFADMFPRLAAELDVALVEFLLDGVAGEPELNLADGIHPTAQGHRRIVNNLMPVLEALVASLRSEAAAVAD